MEQSINIMVERITRILEKNKPSIFLFGSVVLDDFRLGWSDIDIICLTNSIIQEQQAEELVNLRQTLLSEYSGNPYFRLFEGGMLTLEAFIQNIDDIVVYWGTSGQRITNNYELCPFSRMELLENGKQLYGNDFRHLITYPTRTEIVEAVRKQYGVIREYASTAQYKFVRSTDWFLTIARCLYTLKTNKVISKTKAGEWVLENNLFPDKSVVELFIKIRENPIKYNNDDDTLKWIASSAGEYIAQFTDVLEAELRIL